MVFNSFAFILFFAVFCLIYFALKKQMRLFFILAASIFFYYFFSPKGILILGSVVVFNYFTGIYIERWKRKQLLLTISIIANVGLLFVFKYFDFFNASLTDVLGSAGISNPLPMLHLLLPAGISFYALQAIGYNIDVYHELQEAEKNFTVFATFFFFFPKIAQGPIERPRNLLPQLSAPVNISWINISNGVKLAAWGLFKKVVIADRLAFLVDNVYDHPHDYTGIQLLLAGLFYTFQLYADFSGYTDMAVGVAQIMGYNIMQNFNHPFASTSVTDFWKRWNISFSTWLFEYIYNPLSLSKRKWGQWGMVFAIFITFIISGLWHGVGWIFVLWGVLNGVVLGYEVLTAKARKNFWKKFSPSMARALSVAITFIFTVLSFTFARANNIADGVYIIKHAFTSLKASLVKFIHGDINIHEGIRGFDFNIGVLCITLLLTIHLFRHRFNIWNWIMVRPIYIRWSVYYIVMLGILWFGVYENKKFIYFQF